MICEYEEVRITPPKDPTFLERIGYEEVEITTADGQTLTVLAKKEDVAKVCSAVVCKAVAACTDTVCEGTVCNATVA